MALRPDDAQAIRGLLFAFEDLVNLDQKYLATVLGALPIDSVILALRDTETSFQDAILSSLPARLRRMAESELRGTSNASARDIADARRAVVNVVLKLAREGTIEVPRGGAAGEEAQTGSAIGRDT
jgi:flagellar motor switch protein FliG